MIGARAGTQMLLWPRRRGRDRAGLKVTVQLKEQRSRGTRLRRRGETADDHVAVDRSAIGCVARCSDHGGARAHLAGLSERCYPGLLTGLKSGALAAGFGAS